MTCFLRRGAAALLTLCLALPLFGCSGSDAPTESKTPRSDTAVATLCAVGDIRITDELLQAARQRYCRQTNSFLICRTLT